MHLSWRDDLGSSCCLHAAAVAKRLGRQDAEEAALPQAPPRAYAAWLAGLREQVTVEEASGSRTLWQVTSRGRDWRAQLAARPPHSAFVPAADVGVPEEP